MQNLKDLLSAKQSFSSIVEEIGRSVDSVFSKINRLGLKYDDDEEQKNFSLSSSFADFPLPEDLPSIETQLRVLAGVIEKLQKGEHLRLFSDNDIEDMLDEFFPKIHTP